jgi:hypothetical protein
MNKNATLLFSLLSRRVGLLSASILMLFGSMEVKGQYCAATSTSCTNDFINNFSTTNGCLNILNLGTGCAGTSSYNDYTATQTHSTLLSSTVFFSYTLGGNATTKIVRIWVDYNGDNDFIDNGEQVYTSALVNPNVVTSGSFVVSPGATATSTRMRVRVTPTTATTSCGNTVSGETEDYSFLIAAPTACSSAPVAGTASANNSNVCYNSGTTLTLTGSTCQPGITYQWQYFDGSIWQPATGTNTNPTYNTGNLTVATQYRAQLTCGVQSATSTPITVNVNTIVPPYLETFEGITANNQLPPCMAATNMGTNVQTFITSPQSGNRINNTAGGSKYLSFRNISTSTYVYTPALYLTFGVQYQLNFWYITDGQPGWNNFAMYFGPTATPGGMVNSIGSLSVAGTPALNNTSYQQFIGTFTPPSTGVYFVGFYSQAATTPNQYLTIDDINIIPLPSCNGMPDAGTVFPASPISVCTGQTAQLTTVNSTAASDLAYQWQSSTDGTNFTDVTGGTGFNSLTFITPPNYATTYYRLRLTCTNTNQVDYSDVVEVAVATATYAPLPFTETFETWSDRCFTTDVPGVNWATVPPTGNRSWRRDDEGASAAWTTPANGANVPASAEGSHSARFHSTGATPAASTGNLDLLVNCSGVTGDVEVQFYYMNISGLDSMKVFISTDGGGNFTQLGGYGQASIWTLQSFMFTSTSAQTIVRFQGKSEGIASGTDIGIDAVQVLPPCAGTPNPGTITSASPCPGANFGLSLTGGSPAAGLTYEWQQSAFPGGPWALVPGGTQPILTTNISDTTYFQVVLTCINNGATATSAVKEIPLNNFYYCYCTSNATATAGIDIGNFTVKTIPGGYPVLDNGVGTPLINNPNANNLYSNFTGLGPIVTYLDSSLRFIITQNNTTIFQAGAAAVFVDLDHNGVFDATEQVLDLPTASTTIPPQQVNDTFTVPSNALLGITGVRVVIVAGGGPVSPCGQYTNGETEDYLLDIQYHPCNGPANPGTAFISDTTGCVGYNIVIGDTTHEAELSNLEWIWEYSPDGNSWSDLPNSANKDTMAYLVTGPTYFRMRMTCLKPDGIDVTYSNVVDIQIASPYACYCYSIADGASMDTSDNSLFKIGGYEISTPGPHLLNPTAIDSRTDFTDQSNFDLWVDTTYTIEVYHTLRGGYHSDAKVTLFMDLNNDFLYSPSERMWTTYTAANNFYVTTQLTIPASVITSLKTGMRLILNNDIGVNSPSDDGCGVYTSGETEDYVVTFHNALLGVKTVGEAKLSGVDIYPNPSKGRFSLDLHGSQALGDAIISVTNVTGQTIATYDYRNVPTNFSTEIDLTGQAKGVYFVEVKAGSEKTVRKVVVQ